MRALVANHLAMGCAGILAMPNTSPPVSRVHKKDPGEGWSIEEYLEMLRKAGGSKFTDIIVPLYLTKDTTPRMIEEGAKSGLCALQNTTRRTARPGRSMACLSRPI